jgi:hypothetical protein
MPGDHPVVLPVDAPAGIAKESPSRAPKAKVLKKAVAAPQAKPSARPGQLVFGKVEVQGKPKNPQLDFDRERLDVGRADEATTPDFFPKVFETEAAGF